jgi:hypothetical protein
MGSLSAHRPALDAGETWGRNALAFDRFVLVDRRGGLYVSSTLIARCVRVKLAPPAIRPHPEKIGWAAISRGWELEVGCKSW